jgi:hypothetical protein
VAKIKVQEEKKERRKEANSDRRANTFPVATERRKVQRRRQIDPTTCERDYTPEEIEFMQAFDEYKRKSGRMFPTCSEILEVIKAMGYAKVSPAPLLASAEMAAVSELPALTQA